MNVLTSDGLPRKPRRSLVVALAPDRIKQIARTRRHTRLVRILRVLLPLAAIAVLGLYFVSSNITIRLGDMQASVGDLQVRSDSLRMVNPKLEGVTQDNGAYKLTADFADQDVNNMQILRLHVVRAQLTQPEDAWSKLSAPKGTFDTKKETLVLYGGIEITTSTGMTVKLERADIDLKTQTIASKVPVQVAANEGTLTAKQLEIKTAEKRILFTGDVHVHIIRDNQSLTKDGQPERVVGAKE